VSFAVGDHVHVRSLGKGTVRELRKGGRCVVEIKGRSLVVHERELSPVDRDPPRGLALSADAAAVLTRGPVPSTIDLHGKTTAEAVTALDEFISDAILAGLAEVRVIHGRSGGRLKATVHARLKALPSVRAFRLDPANPGATIVVF
jgi:DNA mismatch repair protein MutS2